MSLNKPTQTILSTLYYPYIQHPLGGTTRTIWNIVSTCFLLPIFIDSTPMKMAQSLLDVTVGVERDNELGENRRTRNPSSVARV
jgi:hypothetical protein